MTDLSRENSPSFTAEQLRHEAKQQQTQGIHYSVAAMLEVAAMLVFAARLVERTTWQPIETAPKDGRVMFWVRPKNSNEAYTDTSGRPIVSSLGGVRGVIGAHSRQTRQHLRPSLPDGH